MLKSCSPRVQVKIEERRHRYTEERVGPGRRCFTRDPDCPRGLCHSADFGKLAVPLQTAKAGVYPARDDMVLRHATLGALFAPREAAPNSDPVFGLPFGVFCQNGRI